MPECQFGLLAAVEDEMRHIYDKLRISVIGVISYNERVSNDILTTIIKHRFTFL